MEKVCESCGLWRGYPSGSYESEKCAGQVGECKSPKLVECGLDRIPVDGLGYEADHATSAFLYTAAEFGCVHWIAREPASPELMPAARAIETAKLWRAGKLIGGDEQEVINALLAELERLGAA